MLIALAALFALTAITLTPTRDIAARTRREDL